MESENITFLQVLRIKDVQLWELKDGEAFIRDRGYLYVLYSQARDFFILRVHDQKWALDKNLHIIGTTVSQDRTTKLFTYLIPSPSGFFMIKLLDPNPGVAHNNLETIFEKTANFTRRSGLEKHLASFPEHKVAGVLEKTAETVKEGVLDAVGAITKAFSSVEIDAHPNQRLKRSFDELKQVDSDGSPVVDISKTELQNLRQEGEEISRNHLNTNLWKGFTQGGQSHSEQVDLLNADTGSNSQGHPSGSQNVEADTGNIDKMINANGMDNQGIVGTENQRLPAYEVRTTKDQVEQGLSQASYNLSSGIIIDVHEHMLESHEFGIGLMSGPELSDEQINVIQTGSSLNIDAPFATSTSQPNASSELDLLSDVANPSLSTKDSEFDTQKSLDIPFNSTGSNLGEASNKGGLGFQEKSSEKQSGSAKKVDKENVGGTVTV